MTHILNTVLSTFVHGVSLALIVAFAFGCVYFLFCLVGVLTGMGFAVKIHINQTKNKFMTRVKFISQVIWAIFTMGVMWGAFEAMGQTFADILTAMLLGVVVTGLLTHHVIPSFTSEKTAVNMMTIHRNVKLVLNTGAIVLSYGVWFWYGFIR